MEGLRQCLSHFLEQSESFLEINWRLEGAFDKVSGDKTRLKSIPGWKNRLKYANQDLISELLIILDNFERAIKLDDNNLNDELSKFLKGFKMMYASLDDLLKKYGLEEIEAFHKEYDPNVMEALMTDNDPEFEDDEVLEVLLKGYKLKDRVIRPASVRVNKLETENSEDNNKEKGEDNNE